MVALFRSIEAVGGQVAFKATSTESITIHTISRYSHSFAAFPKNPYVFAASGSKGLLYKERAFSYTTKF